MPAWTSRPSARASRRAGPARPSAGTQWQQLSAAQLSTTRLSAARLSAGTRRLSARTARALAMRRRTVAPVAALAALLLGFGFANGLFFGVDGLSLLAEQSLVIGTLALGQTLVVLLAGVDFANAAIAVFATLLIAKLATTTTSAPVALLAGIGAAAGIALVAGGLATVLRIPSFLVTFGLLVIVGALSDRYAQDRAYTVDGGPLTWLGTTKYLFGRIELTYGMGLLLAMYAAVWLLLRTRWGARVRRIGSDQRAARRDGIPVRRTTLTVFLVAGLCYGIAAWQALGRVPIADPDALPLGNLDSIAAVLVGGVSLFGGRGGVVGVLAGTLIVAALRTGLAQSQVDATLQVIVIGALMIIAVAVDRFVVGRQR
jgi:fructose transport system permease protein